jgi:hypothetical protein
VTKRRAFHLASLAALPLLVCAFLLSATHSLTVGVNGNTYRSASIRGGNLVILSRPRGVPILPGGVFVSIDPTSGRAGGMWGYSAFRGPADVEVPVWPLVILLAYLPWVPLILRLMRRWQSARLGLCAACGYDLRGTPGRACPECGAARA